jgi:hypothetical protein
MYTDVRAELDEVQGGYCPGLEAAFGQLNAAFKRVTVPSSIRPDGSLPPLPAPGEKGAVVPLPWWDLMRYMWRGTGAVRVRGLTAVMANTADPHVGPEDARLVVTAATLGVSVAAGRIDLTATHLGAVAHSSGPDCGRGALGGARGPRQREAAPLSCACRPLALQLTYSRAHSPSSLPARPPGDPLLVLPAFHVPLANISFLITARMPRGRNPLLHHAFPILDCPPPQGAVQEFVDVFRAMKCEGWSLGIEIAAASDKTAPALGSGRGGGGGRGGGSGLSPTGSPTARCGGGKGQVAPLDWAGLMRRPGRRPARA